MKVYEKDKDGNVLFHSDVYLGKDYTSNNLKHWKYIRKENKNGRWVYYYEDPTKNFGKDMDKQANKIIGIIDKHDKAGTDYRKDKTYKKEAKKYDNIVKNYKKTQGFTFENLKRNISYDLVKPLNAVSEAIYKGKKWLKSLFK